MASHQELVVEWTMLGEDSRNWTLDDLELAAELGRSLLERNEELETELKAQHLINDDQAQEIEFLTKQIGSMKEESLNRTKFYEQLETSLYDLERTNSQLGRKREVDRTRIQRMGENIDYLERKCEELSGTLETFRDSNKKQLHGKLHAEYFGFVGSSDSSEDGNNTGYGYRRRSQSLHDLRDYTPSPDDDFDSNHSDSNSADLKSSENEFIQTLETRVEELIAAKKKETEKISLLESQLRNLIQENTNLQHQLTSVTVEKEEQLHDLRKLILDQSMNNIPAESSRDEMEPFLSPTTPTSISHNFSPKSLNGFRTPSTKAYKTGENTHHHNKVGVPHSSICKRCSTEINILNLVNSIEFENDDYSSLEYELARANSSDSSTASPSLSTRLDAENKPVEPPQSPRLFEHGFLDHFFGTNSILKKIRMRSEECLLDEDVFDEEEELVKDIGPEKYEKSCDDDKEIEPVPLSCRKRKLELPRRIYDDSEQAEPDSNNPKLEHKVLDNCNKPSGVLGGFDESLCDSAEVTVSTKKRSKEDDSLGSVPNGDSTGEHDDGSTNAAPDSNPASPTTIIPEYKQILQNLFTLFNQSKKIYPKIIQD